jgi:predicted GH43/DUF377 family glycosyl hydrolase
MQMTSSSLVLALALACVLIITTPAANGYHVSMQRLMTSPILSSANSPFDYNFNAAYLPLAGGSVGGVPIDCLAVRVQNIVGVQVPSQIAIFCESDDKLSFSREPYVVIDPSQSPAQADGCEDPRVVLLPDNKTLLMFYTAVNVIPNAARAKLSLASCNLVADPQCQSWQLHGAIFPDTFWSKSGALLVRPEGAPHFLFWGDTNISIATTTDFFNYTDTGIFVVETRPEPYFDSKLVESGPPPLQLSDGNFIFLYNSARVSSIPNPKPGWDLQYNVGYVIVNTSLAASHVPQVVERSDVPIFSPTLGWETCDDASMVSGQTPLVVFVEGAKPLSGVPNSFVVYYQGCDTNLGIALLHVSP